MNLHLEYNARNIIPEEVPLTFIESPDYDDLVQVNHTVLLGARGCGKTTLMKMVTLPALNVWGTLRGEDLIAPFKFNAVYISTDIYWNAQKDAYYEQLSRFPKFADLVSKATVTTNVLFALCETFESVIKFRVNEAQNRVEDMEIKVCQDLIESWDLPPTIPSLIMIKAALLKRADLINRIIQKVVFNHENEEGLKISEEFFFLDFYTLSVSAIESFERTFGTDKSLKWALCFDELELAPEWLQKRLYGSLRSRNQKIIYKLSASPIVNVGDSFESSGRNDLTLVKMWPHESGKHYPKFCETLVHSVLKKHFGDDVSAEEVFGSNPILLRDSDRGYNEGGHTWKVIKEEAQHDKVLRKLLEANSINPENPATEDSGKLDTVLRKIKPTVYFRNYYSAINKHGVRKRRSRKAQTLFYGKEVIYKISDGNPRWLLASVYEILKHGSKKRKKIPNADQAKALTTVARQFENIIRTVPNCSKLISNKLYTLSGLLTEIGDGFFQEIVLGDLKLDPKGTFLVDSDVPEQLHDMIEKGVYQGALVLLDPFENAFDFEISGKRFRLAYMLHPIFKLPLRGFKRERLSKCLTGKESRTVQGEIDFK